MQNKCELCKFPVMSALTNPDFPGTSVYWRLKEFPDYSKGVLFFCGSRHASEYNEKLKKGEIK